MIKYLLVILTLFSTIGCGHYEKEILVSKDQIQSAIDKKFPYDKNLVVVRLTLDSAQIYFKETNIGVSLAYYGNFLRKEISGRVDFNGEIYYRPKKGAFYLREFEIVEFSVNQNDFSNSEKLQATVLKMLKNYLDDYPVYTLRRSDFKQNMARMVLKEVYVVGDNLAIKLVI